MPTKNKKTGRDLIPPLLKKIPDPPEELSENGKKEWKRVCKLLFIEQLLTEWDLPSIKIMCMEWDRYIKAVIYLSKNKSYQSTKNGYETLRPMVSERDKGFANYSKMLDKFGGNLIARSKMKRVEAVKGVVNPYEGI